MLRDYLPLISTVLSFFAADYFYCTILKKRPSIRNPKLTLCIFNLLYIALYFFTQNHTFIKNILGISYLLLPCILFFEDDILHRLCAYFSTLSVMIVSEMLISSIFLIANILFPALAWAPSTMLENGNTITLTLYVLLLFGLQMLFSYKLAQTLKDYFVLLRPYLLLKTGCSIIVSLISQNLFAACGDYQAVLNFTPIYFILTIISLFLFNSTLKGLAEEIEHISSLQAQKLYAERQLQSFKNNALEYQHIREWNHDISNHLLSLSYLITSDKTSEAVQYIDSLLEKHSAKEDSHEIP